jgi:hypothetical protein
MQRPYSYAAKHRKRWLETGEGWDRLLREDDFKLLASHPQAEGFVESMNLRFGLYCFYAGDGVRGAAFCQRAIAVADRIETDDLCRVDSLREAGYPHNMAVVVRGRTYGQWLLGQPLNRHEMRRVATLLVEWCLDKATDRKRFHDSMTMCYYLQGVRAAVIASDLDYASELLKIKHKFRWHHAGERDLWTRFIVAYPDVPQEMRDELENFFDRVRDPDFKEEEWSDTAHRFIPTFINRDILALETGIIRQMYLVNASPLDLVDPQAVIDAVAY